jgi:hypothetical protein
VVVNIGYFAWQFTPVDRPAAVVNSASSRTDNGDDITLLSETDQSSLVVSETDKSTLIELQELVNKPIVNTTKVVSTDGCMAVGPFMSFYGSQEIADQLTSLGINLQVKAVDQPSGKYDYRLLIPPMNSLEEAFRKLRELQASNIDSYVITAGENALGVSLGVFSTLKGAAAATALVKSEGFEGVIVEIPRSTRTYWIFGTPDSPLAMNEMVWQNLKTTNPAIQKQELPCE